MRDDSGRPSFVVFARPSGVAIGSLVLAVTLTCCGSFGQAPSTEDASAEDASADGSVIHCGPTTCPVASGSVCCATTSGRKCMTATDCTAANGARIECDDNRDCEQLGFTTLVCCGIQAPAPSDVLLRSECLLSSACDANGPRDQLCDPKVDTPQCEVAKDGRTACKPITYSNVSGDSYYACKGP